MTCSAFQLMRLDVEYHLFMARYLEYLDTHCFVSCHLSVGDKGVFR